MERSGMEKFQAGEDVIGRLWKEQSKGGDDPKAEPRVRVYRGARCYEEACSEESVAGEPDSDAPHAVRLWLCMQD